MRTRVHKAALSSISSSSCFAQEELKGRKFQASRYESELLLEDLDLFKCNVNVRCHTPGCGENNHP